LRTNPLYISQSVCGTEIFTTYIEVYLCFYPVQKKNE
jgi:hypothetical protein